MQSPTSKDILKVSEYRHWIIKATPAIASVNELEQYLLEPQIKKDQRDRFSMLVKMAINIYFISSMFAKLERMFSRAKHTIFDKKPR